MTKNVKPLTPVDMSQCQAERPNNYSFMTLGGRPGLERCTNQPTMIATEKVPGPDGQIGSMSLCDHCFSVMQKQCPDMAFFERIKEPA